MKIHLMIILTVQDKTFNVDLMEILLWQEQKGRALKGCLELIEFYAERSTGWPGPNPTFPWDTKAQSTRFVDKTQYLNIT